MFLEAILNIKLPLAEALDTNLLALYPSTWSAVSEPTYFINSLLKQQSFKDILLLSDAYTAQLWLILQELYSINVWRPIIIAAAVYGGVAFALLLIFAVVIGVKSRTSSNPKP